MAEIDWTRIKWHRQIIEHHKRKWRSCGAGDVTHLSAHEYDSHVMAWGYKQDPVGKLIIGAAAMADEYKKEGGTRIADDVIFGPDWQNLIEMIRNLQGAHGCNLVGSLVSALLRDMMRLEGVRVEW